MRAIRGFRHFDWLIFASAAGLALAGLLLVYSASSNMPGFSHLMYKQLLWLAFGVLALLLFYVIDYQSLVHFSYPMLALVTLLLLALDFFGHGSRGSTRWFNLGFFHLQPSELAKLALVLALARWGSEHSREARSFTGLVPPLFLTACIMALVLRQPDLGTTLVLWAVALGMLYVAGARLWHLVSINLALAALLPVAWGFLKDYQKRRWLSFLNPESDALGAGYNAIQSKIAIGSGGLWGKGFMQGTQSQLNFVPMHHTDFVFSVLAEEWGLFGCLAVFLLYMILLLQIAKIAAKARDPKGALVCGGVVAMLGAQVFINAGMTSGLLPVTGITLPLLSYGGSSVLTVMVSLGVVLNIRREGGA